MGFKLEKGIAPTKKHTGRRPLYPFKDMDIGDSFVAPVKARAAAHNYGRRSGRLFSSEKINDNEVRIWRVE